jgi:hypothetical protein
MSQYPKAIKSINRAIAISKTKENQKLLIALQNQKNKKEDEPLNNGNFYESLKKLEKRLIAVKKEYGEYHYKTAKIYTEIANLYLSVAGQPTNALTYAREAYRINKKVFGKKSFKVVDSLWFISNIYLAEHNSEKAYLFAKESIYSILELRK